MLWIEMNADTVGQPCASASKISAASKRVSAEPPTSSRIWTPPMPSAGRLAHHIDRKMLLLVPADRMRRDFSAAKSRAMSRTAIWSSLRANCICLLRLGDHAHSQFIVGMENSAPSLTPEGQREVTVLVLV